MKQYSSEEPYSEEPVVETPLSPENENPFQQCFTSSDNNQHRQVNYFFLVFLGAGQFQKSDMFVCVFFVAYF